MLVTEAKELLENFGERKKADSASNTTPKGRQKSAFRAVKHVAELETELASDKAAHTCLISNLAQAE